MMDLFQYSLAEKIEQIEWKAWTLHQDLYLNELREWSCGDWDICYFPVGFSSVLIDRSLKTLKNH